MGQANVKRWIDDILPLLTDDDPLGVDTSPPTTSRSTEAPDAYEHFQKKERGHDQGRLQPLRLKTPATRLELSRR